MPYRAFSRTVYNETRLQLGSSYPPPAEFEA